MPGLDIVRASADDIPAVMAVGFTPAGLAFMPLLRAALEASWDRLTAHDAIEQPGNPALGQCYPTARVVQHYFPATEIIKGTVWTGQADETHFWNGLRVGDAWHHFDLSWQQFPAGSLVREFTMLDRHHLGDGDVTLQRVDLLLRRVRAYLEHHYRRPGAA